MPLLRLDREASISVSLIVGSAHMARHGTIRIILSYIFVRVLVVKYLLSIFFDLFVVGLV